MVKEALEEEYDKRLQHELSRQQKADDNETSKKIETLQQVRILAILVQLKLYHIIMETLQLVRV